MIKDVAVRYGCVMRFLRHAFANFVTRIIAAIPDGHRAPSRGGGSVSVGAVNRTGVVNRYVAGLSIETQQFLVSQVLVEVWNVFAFRASFLVIPTSTPLLSVFQSAGTSINPSEVALSSG